MLVVRLEFCGKQSTFVYYSEMLLGGQYSIGKADERSLPGYESAFSQHEAQTRHLEASWSP